MVTNARKRMGEDRVEYACRRYRVLEGVIDIFYFQRGVFLGGDVCVCARARVVRLHFIDRQH